MRNNNVGLIIVIPLGNRHGGDEKLKCPRGANYERPFYDNK